MEETDRYKGHRVTVRAVKKETAQELWDIFISIDGTRHLLTAFEDYPPRLFPNAQDALEYGKRAAEYKIDYPTETKEKLV